MSEKLVVESLYKIFGQNPKEALSLLKEGRDKNEIFKQTGQVIGVQDANFSVMKGEIFVVMGLSGSGKSTLVRMLNRLIEPTSGHVYIDGQDVAQLSKKQLIELRRRDMSMVFQSFALMPQLTVVENAAFGLEIAGVERKERERMAKEALERVGLGPNANNYPDELSGGMQQRVGLARALATNPSVLLMDEAFSALDPLIRTEMQDELLRLQQEQERTVIFISHDLDEAMRIGDRIAVMHGGNVVQVGSSDEILRNPANEYVKAFFNNVNVAHFLTAGDVALREQVTIIERSDDVAGGMRAALERLRHYDREFGYVEDRSQRFLGVVSASTLVNAIESGKPRFRDAYLPDVDPVPSQTHLEEMLPKVVESPCPLPVIDENGAYKGAVSRTVLLRKLYEAM
jgi:glycine betaine/proline transport system ATP-binding protein